MRFEPAELQREFETSLHPEVRAVVEELDEWCEDSAIPQAVVVGLSRTPERNTAVGGSPTSWHLFGCAADLRNKHYAPGQLSSVWAWLQRRCPKPEWELRDHNVKTGRHFHIARRDFSWRNTFEKRPG